jgi:hypothetical protein
MSTPPQPGENVPILAAALTPARADDVCDAATRRLLESRFEVRWAGDDLGPAALPGLLAGAGVVLTSWGTPRLTAEALAGCARWWWRTPPAASRTCSTRRCWPTA